MDQQIFDLIAAEEQRQVHGIELIASENYVSNEVMRAMGSVLTNKYAEGYPGHRYYGGCQVVDQIEQIAIDRLCKLFDAEFANVQPHSGAQANQAVFLAVMQPGDTFLGLSLEHGGHYERMRAIADEVGALLMIDMAHPAGLIAAGLLKNPIHYAHIVTSTTHKTLRGPRGGVILMGKDFDNPWGITNPKGETKKMSQLINSAVFPGIQGGPLEHVIAAKAVAFGEALRPEFKVWAAQVQKNAATLAEELTKRGFDIVSGGTENHSMLIDLRNKYPEISGKQAENALVAADITVNKNMVPFDNRSAFQTSGIRLGTAAITSRGAKEDLVVKISELIERVLDNYDNESIVAEVRSYVNDLMKGYPLFAW